MAPRKTAAAAQPDLLTVEAVSSGTLKTGDKITEAGKPDRVVGDVATGKRATRLPPAANANLPVTSPTKPQSMLSVIASAAANPKVDAAKMRELLDMQKEITAEEARLTFTRCYRALRREIPIIGRDGKIIVKEKGTGKVTQTTPFSTYENLMQVCEPILDRHGFSFMSAVEPTADASRINIVSWLDHDDGFQRVSRFPLPADTTGSKNNTQGWGSSSSYGKRYNAILLLNIISLYKRDADNNGYDAKDVVEGESESIQTLSENEVSDLSRAIMECGVPFPTFCKTWKIQKLEQLPVADLAEALKRCAEYKARAAEAARK